MMLDAIFNMLYIPCKFNKTLKNSNLILNKEITKISNK